MGDETNFAKLFRDAIDQLQLAPDKVKELLQKILGSLARAPGQLIDPLYREREE